MDLGPEIGTVYEGCRWNILINDGMEKRSKICVYDKIYGFFDGLAIARSYCFWNGSSEYGFIDQEGKSVIECIYSKVEQFNGGLALVEKGGTHTFEEDAGGEWGYIDKKGNEYWENKK